MLLKVAIVLSLLAMLASLFSGLFFLVHDAGRTRRVLQALYLRVGLAALTLLYGTAFTLMFTLLPRLGVVGSSPILNVEPVAALLLAWALLGQRIAPLQWVGALLVVGAVMGLGLRRR